MSAIRNLYRKRTIPQETIHLKDDSILYDTDSFIVTKWKSLKPRPDLSHGISAYFIDRNFKISKFYNHNNELICWYCDIIHTIKNDADHSIIFEDLLIDITVDSQNAVKVIDLDELAIAHSQGLISDELMHQSLHTANELLAIIYEGDFIKYQAILNQYESAALLV